MKSLCTLLFALFSAASYSQNASADKWFFGVHAGVDFTGGIATALTYSAISTNEGCATISDANGQFLFYTDGISVWNKNHQVMPNGSGLLGGISSTQSALIVPSPASATEYYIFTVDEIGGPNGFRYSIVDMALQANLGDVTIKNSLILNNVTEKLTAIKQTGTGNYRIAVHEWNTDAYYVYSLTAAGLQAVPVISNVGIVHTNSVIQNTYGQLKFSPCGDKLGAAIGYLDTIEVFDFDDATGIISNPVSLPAGHHVYGLEFSHGGQYLYASTYDTQGTLVQYDLFAGNTAAVIASKTVISATPDIYGLQLAADGKIYAAKSFNQFLGIIDQPSLPGISCNYIDMGLDLDPQFTGNTSALSLPGFVQSVFRDELACPAAGISKNYGALYSIAFFPVPASDEIKITSEGDFIIDKLILSDIRGKHIKTFSNIFQTEFTADISSLLPGVYLARIYGKNFSVNLKVLKK